MAAAPVPARSHTRDGARAGNNGRQSHFGQWTSSLERTERDRGVPWVFTPLAVVSAAGAPATRLEELYLETEVCASSTVIIPSGR